MENCYLEQGYDQFTTNHIGTTRMSGKDGSRLSTEIAESSGAAALSFSVI